MSDKGKDFYFQINGVSISQYVKLFDIREADELFPGVKKLGPIEISGRWDDGTKDCIVCGGSFVPGPEGTAYLTVEQTGERFGPVCHACGTSLMSPTKERS